MRKIVRGIPASGVSCRKMKEEKRRKLIEAAINEFNEYGLEGASYNRIIERSGLSKGSVYYHVDNKDALLGMVMEDIGERVLNAVPERELPRTREEFWETFWDYRQRKFDFFASNISLGRILIMSLGNRELPTEEVKAAFAPLARLIERQTKLFQRGQELGAVRRDLDVNLIFELMRTIDRTLCINFFGREPEDIERLSRQERTERSRDYTQMFKDLARRLLEPETNETCKAEAQS